jgi:hypothetical protein
MDRVVLAWLAFHPAAGFYLKSKIIADPIGKAASPAEPERVLLENNVLIRIPTVAKDIKMRRVGGELLKRKRGRPE